MVKKKKNQPSEDVKEEAGNGWKRSRREEAGNAMDVDEIKN